MSRAAPSAGLAADRKGTQLSMQGPVQGGLHESAVEREAERNLDS
jgi:hypothetical protein